MPFRFLAAPLVLGFLVFLGGCDAGGRAADSGLVARAGDHTFTVEAATELLEGNPSLPNSEDLVRVLANVWVDYVLLAEAAQSDPSLESVDLEPVLTPQFEQQLVVEFRDSVVAPDTTFTEEELRRAYETGGEGVQVRARHILLAFPQGASDAQRDSVDSLARELRSRILEGEDFAALAQEYSDDPGSASRGGDLGSFGRGQMVPAFEEAAFALDSGEVSEPVETPYGLHVIEVTGRETPDFEENRDRFARQLRQRRTSQAESAYVAELEANASVRVQDGAPDVVRGLAARPGGALTSRAARRPLVRFEGGALTAAEMREFLQGRTPQERNQLDGAPDAQIERILENLARREIVLAEAREAGFEIPAARQDTLRTQLRERLRQAVTELGLDSISPTEGQSDREAIDRAVESVLARTLAGRQNVLPLGNLSFTLRRDAGAEIYPAGISMVVTRLEQLAEPDTVAGPAPSSRESPTPSEGGGSGSVGDTTP